MRVFPLAHILDDIDNVDNFELELLEVVAMDGWCHHALPHGVTSGNRRGDNHWRLRVPLSVHGVWPTHQQCRVDDEGI